MQADVQQEARHTGAWPPVLSLQSSALHCSGQDLWDPKTLGLLKPHVGDLGG